jgi:subtilisin family serine protease
MPRTPFYPRAILSVVAITAAFLGTACSDSTGPSTGTEGPDGASPKSQVQDIPGKSAADTGLSAEFATQAALQVGAKGSAEAVPQGARVGDVIPGQYIVIYKDGMAGSSLSNAPALTQRLMVEHGGTVRRTFQVFNGFSANLTAAAAEALRHNPNVSVVEPNRVITPAGIQYMETGNNQSWGLDRIDQVFRPLSGTMSYSHTGAGVYIYIIDTGIRASHPEFGGRARNVASWFGDTGDDCYGHGTHVAGIAGGASYGVAKKAQLRGVKVFDCLKGGSTEATAWGIDWVYRYRVNPAVANISMQTCDARACTPSPAIDLAATKLANSGVFVAVAAGNYNRDACLSSPARAPGTFTVAASTSTDGRRLDSNWGKCVDAYAPGDQILSAGLASYGAVLGGTSMAAPHVAGVAALFKQAYGNVASATLVSRLKSWATPNVISSGSYGSTPNLLLYKGGL